MKVPFLDLKAHHAPLRGHFKTAIAEVIDSGIFAGGPAVADFEEAFAAFCKCDYAVGLGSGTEAVWLALLACGVGPGDEVITVPSIRVDELGRWAKSAVLVFILGKTLARLVKQVPLSQITSNWLTRFACCATTARRGNIIIP